MLVDESKAPDEHNPRGYFEHARALNLGHAGETTDWVAEAQGKAVKVIAYQLQHLPTTFDYRVIFMRRKVIEVLASWGKMGLTRPDVALSERQQILAFKTEYAIYEARMMQQKNMRALFVQYNDLLAQPRAQIARVCEFLAVRLDAQAMEGAIDPALYRNRL